MTESRDLKIIGVQDVQIVNVPERRHLCALHDFVRHARIIRVDLESKIFEVATKLAIEQQRAAHHSVHRGVAFRVQNWLTLFVRRDILSVYLRVDLHH